MTDEELKAIEERANAACPPPWSVADFGNPGEYEVRSPAGCVTQGGEPAEHSGMDLADADFIAHARDDIPALIAEVRRLRGLIKQAEWEGNWEGESACPWCQEPGWSGQHAADCPTFSVK